MLDTRRYEGKCFALCFLIAPNNSNDQIKYFEMSDWL